MWRTIGRHDLDVSDYHLMFAGSYNGYAVLTHQAAHTAVPDVQANLFQLFRHARSAIAAQAETRLFFDMCQRHQIGPLPAGRLRKARNPRELTSMTSQRRAVSKAPAFSSMNLNRGPSSFY